ncbi:hypothetical protein TanjilG_09169 [Lupinus angustifolius]|uniref:THH1/TOM1/TOM3 domain-containing protein n=1 Tax=Lupinus angustifolius TaxID=3871 RepID=A0A1J7I1D8_LUPAN|nr:hypothetical protein TanjilG_09169 [Lupinus angustifolius]
MSELGDSHCFSRTLLAVNVGIALFHGVIAFLSFFQPNDDYDYEGSFCEEGLLEKTSNELASIDNNRKCFPVRFSRVGTRQKIVILVAMLVFITMMAFAVIIWIGLGQNPIDSEVAVKMLHDWHQYRLNDVHTSFLLILYYFVGSSIPSALILWVMRELPHAESASMQEESSTIAFVADSSVAIHHPQRWITAASMQNQVPISHNFFSG